MLLKRYSPLVSVVVAVLTPVASLVNSTLAPGSAAPLGSFTVPVRLESVAWPNNITVKPSSARNRNRGLLFILSLSDPLDEFAVNLLARGEVSTGQTMVKTYTPRLCE